MLPLLVLAAALFAGQPAVKPASCWTTLEPRAEYAAAQQVRDLQARVKAGACDVIGTAWTSKATAAPHNLILWDGKQQTLWRVTVDRQAVRWEKWTGASRERILVDDPGDGFTLGAYSQGKGRATISPSAGGFVKQHAPARFDPALPVNCDAPAPAADAPPFLTKCSG